MNCFKNLLVIVLMLGLVGCGKSAGTVLVESVGLDAGELTFYIGDGQTLVATVLPENATSRTVAWRSDKPALVQVDKSGKVTAMAIGEATITATAGGETAECRVTVLDGVLINGVVWAQYNVDQVGTFVGVSEAAGKFYQWNKKVAWDAVGSVTGWDTNPPVGGSWAAENDPSPEGWRVPTLADIESLLDTRYVASNWMPLNGVQGRRFMDIATKASIFLPEAGYRNASGVLSNAATFYWSSETSLNTCVLLNINDPNTILTSNPFGAVIRPVLK